MNTSLERETSSNCKTGLGLNASSLRKYQLFLNKLTNQQM